MKILFKLAILLLFMAGFGGNTRAPLAAEIMNVPQGSTIPLSKIKKNTSAEESAMQMRLLASGKEIVFELNDSPAAKDLYAQFPIASTVENYGHNEKIFYPPQKLKTGDSPLVKSATTGTLAYYAPWGNVVMFYGQFGSAAGLYELGHAIKGSEYIKCLDGTITIAK